MTSPEGVRAVGRKATVFKAHLSNRDDVYSAVYHAEKDSAVPTSWSTTPEYPDPPDRLRHAQEFDKIMRINLAGVIGFVDYFIKKVGAYAAAMSRPTVGPASKGDAPVLPSGQCTALARVLSVCRIFEYSHAAST